MLKLNVDNWYINLHINRHTNLRISLLINLKSELVLSAVFICDTIKI